MATRRKLIVKKQRRTNYKFVVATLVVVLLCFLTSYAKNSVNNVEISVPLNRVKKGEKLISTEYKVVSIEKAKLDGVVRNVVPYLSFRAIKDLEPLMPIKVSSIESMNHVAVEMSLVPTIKKGERFMFVSLDKNYVDRTTITGAVGIGNRRADIILITKEHSIVVAEDVKLLKLSNGEKNSSNFGINIVTTISNCLKIQAAQSKGSLSIVLRSIGDNETIRNKKVLVSSISGESIPQNSLKRAKVIEQKISGFASYGSSKDLKNYALKDGRWLLVESPVRTSFVQQDSEVLNGASKP